MAGRSLLDHVESQLERIFEDPFMGAAPFDVKDLRHRLAKAFAEVDAARVPSVWHVRFPVSL
ncbi:MAG: hypothetical protein ACYC1C_14795, partial [Chloroflexota bacterium]